MIDLQDENLSIDLELLAKQEVEGFIIGLHKSPFHGFSIEFAEHRLYNPGDSLKHIDWKVFGKTDRMFVKKYEEETNLRCCVALDVSSSMYFSADGKTKLQQAAIAAASVLTILKKQLDAGAIALFDEDLKVLTPFKSSARHYRNLILQLQQTISTETILSKKTDISKALHEIAERIHQRSLVVIFSDLSLEENGEQALIDALLHLKHNKHEIILFQVIDAKLEKFFQFEHRPYELVDMESGKSVKLHPHEVQNVYQQRVLERISRVKDVCLNHKIDFVIYDYQQPIRVVLTEYLQKRSKMM